MKKRLLLTLLFALTGSALLAQDSWDTIGEAVPGYYIKNGIRYNTLIELESDELRAKRLYLPRQYGLNQEIYTPEEISEYGTLRERRFVSVDLGGEWFFMEVLQQVDHDTSIVFLSHKVRCFVYYLQIAPTKPKAGQPDVARSGQASPCGNAFLIDKAIRKHHNYRSCP